MPPVERTEDGLAVVDDLDAPIELSERPVELTSDELLKIARRNMRFAAVGRTGELSMARAELIVQSMVDILSDPDARKQHPAAAKVLKELLVQDYAAQDSGPTTVNAKAAFIGTVSPQMLEELERQQLQANQTRALEAQAAIDEEDE